MSRSPADAPLLTIAQVAEQFGVSRRTVTRWIASGALRPVLLPSAGVGAHRFQRFTRAEVDAFWANLRRRSA